MEEIEQKDKGVTNVTEVTQLSCGLLVFIKKVKKEKENGK